MNPSLSSILVHIGYHKTGTTWLQKHLFDRDDRGFFPLSWANKEGPALAKDMGRLFYRYEQKYLTSFVFDEIREDIKYQLYEQSNIQPQKMAVISNERLVGSLHQGGFDGKEMANRIHSLLPQAKIFMVIREQVDMIHSTYYQYLKMGGTQDLTSYLNEIYVSRAPGFSLAHLQYHRLISYYNQLFGPENVLVLPYELFKHHPSTFIDRLAEFSGTPIAEKLDFSIRDNKGLNKYVAYKTRFLNVFVRKNSLNGFSPLYAPSIIRKGIYYLKGSLQRLISKQKVYAFSQKQRETITEIVGDFYAKSNQITSEMIGLSLTDHGYQADQETLLEKDIQI